jgi:hypothetical protein
MGQKEDRFKLAAQQYEKFLQEHPRQAEAIFHLSRPSRFNPDDSVVIKEVALPRYGTDAYPLDLRYYKQISRVIAPETVQKLKKDHEV